MELLSDSVSEPRWSNFVSFGEVEDAVDRAMRHRRMDKVRVVLKEIGFWPGNRGGVGINSPHVHDVRLHIMREKCRLQLYDHVDLVEVPEPMLTEFKRVNKARCDGDPLLPAFSPAFWPEMKSGVQPRHCKLCAAGTHTL